MSGVLVEAFEDGVGDGEGVVVVVAGEGQAADEDVEAGGGGCVVLFVAEVGLVHDVCDGRPRVSRTGA